jgi:hypothetical protein
MADHNATRSTNRREYLRAVGGVAAASTVGLAGCMGSSEATGLLSTTVTDQPGDIADFESCVVTIDGIWVKPAESDDEDSEDETNETEDGVQEQQEGDVDQGEGREYYEFEEPQEADLVNLQGGETQLVDEDRELPVGSYEFLQLDISGVTAILADSGEEATVDTPGNAPLQFKLAFEIREGERTIFTGDFTPVKRGQTGRYLLQPVATNTGVSYEEIDAEETDGNETEQ